MSGPESMHSPQGDVQPAPPTDDDDCSTTAASPLVTLEVMESVTREPPASCTTVDYHKQHELTNCTYSLQLWEAEQ
jgi:hypothetical protein